MLLPAVTVVGSHPKASEESSGSKVFRSLYPIKTFLFEPDKIVTTYPELLHYVNKSSPLKNKKNILTESDSDNSEIENDNNDSDDSDN